MKLGLNWVKVRSNLTKPVKLLILGSPSFCHLHVTLFPSSPNKNNRLQTRCQHGDNGKLPWGPDHTETHHYRRNYALGSVVRLSILHAPQLAIVSNLKEVQLCAFCWKVKDDSTPNNCLKMGCTANGFAGNTFLAMHFRVISCVH